MTRVGHLNQHGIDHRQIERRRHAVVEEAGVGHDALFVVDVLLIEGPADALHGAALHLPLHIARMNRLADILHGGVAQNRDLACLRIDLHVDNVRREAAANTGRIDACPADDGAAGRVQLPCQFPERETLAPVRPALQDAVFIADVVRLDVPDLRRPRDHLPLDILRCFIGGPARGEGDAAATGHVGVADPLGIADHRPHILCGDAQRLGELHGDGGARAADVGGTLDETYRAVDIDTRGHGRLEADVEPEPGGDAAAALRPAQRCLVMRMLLCGFAGLDHADPWIDGAVGSPRPFLRAVLDAEIERVDLQFLADLVDHRLDGESRVGRSRCPIGRRGRLVDDDVVAVDHHIRHVVAGKDAHGPGADRRPGIGPGFISQIRLCRRQPALSVRGQFHANE